MQKWSIDNLEPSALGVSASRRTDIPALYAAWFSNRLREGFAEYIPAGPPRRVRRSLRPEDVTHFNFWTKWPRPFFRALEHVLEAGYPVLFNVTISGLGGTELEPHVPPPEKAAAALVELSSLVPPAAIQWRYDPLFLSGRYGVEHHLRVFSALIDRLAGRVDRVATSLVQIYGRRVKPDLQRYHRESGDSESTLSRTAKADLLGCLQEIARGAGLPFTVCCQPELREALGCPRSECNGWAWACRVYPELGRHRHLKSRPTRRDCGCSEEIDIGVYDTCILGCRYSYASCSLEVARRNAARHEPSAPCLIP